MADFLADAELGRLLRDVMSVGVNVEQGMSATDAILASHSALSAALSVERDKNAKLEAEVESAESRREVQYKRCGRLIGELADSRAAEREWHGRAEKFESRAMLAEAQLAQVREALASALGSGREPAEPTTGETT